MKQCEYQNFPWVRETQNTLTPQIHPHMDHSLIYNEDPIKQQNNI